MTHVRRALGDLGERLAAEHLTQSGLHIIERNWRDGRRGEVDIIAADPAADCYAVVEVRTRVGDRCGTGYASVDWKKYTKLRTLAAAWLQAQPVKRHIRIDIVSITVGEVIRHALENGVRPDDLSEGDCDLLWVQGVYA